MMVIPAAIEIINAIMINMDGYVSNNIHPTPPNTVKNKKIKTGLIGKKILKSKMSKSMSNPSIPAISKRLPNTKDIIVNPNPTKKHT